MPGMSTGAGPTGSPTLDAFALAPQLALRLALLLSTAALAAAGFARPLARDGDRLVVPAWSASALAALASLASLVAQQASAPLSALQMLLALSLPPLLRWPRIARVDGALLALLLLAETGPEHTGLLFAADVLAALGAVAVLVAAALVRTGTEHRIDTAALAGAAALFAGGIVEAVLSGIGLDRRLYGTGYGILLVALVVLPVAAVVVWARRFRLVGAGAIVLAFLAFGSLPALAKPEPLPQPGVPLLTHAGNAPVLVTPQRPGPNLVHLPASAGHDVSVTTSDGRAVRAEERPGAEGSWAVVNLPEGRSELTVEQHGQHAGHGHHGGASSALEVDAGTGPHPNLPSATGEDGPECASAALGSLAAGERAPLASCPAEALQPEDADALRQLVGFTASRGTPGITIAADPSPRSQQAAQLIRETAAHHHIPATGEPRPDNALLDVTGWPRSAHLLDDIAHRQAEDPVYTGGIHLAPWLLHTPVVNEVPTSFLPLRFNPRDERALTYSVALEHSFGQEAPSTSGFDAWLRARRETPHEPPRLYASAQVSAMPMNTSGAMPGMSGGMGGDYPGQWVSHGTVVPVSGSLTP